jgi:hypothetical protein
MIIIHTIIVYLIHYSSLSICNVNYMQKKFIKIYSSWSWKFIMWVLEFVYKIARKLHHECVIGVNNATTLT